MSAMSKKKSRPRPRNGSMIEELQSELSSRREKVTKLEAEHAERVRVGQEAIDRAKKEVDDYVAKVAEALGLPNPVAREAKRLQTLRQARQRVRDTKVAAEIPEVESQVESLLEDQGLADYLRAHPWPLVLPGPPSMKYTAHDHVVTRQLRYLAVVESDGPPSRYLAELRTYLKLLREQQRRRARGLPPDTDSVPAFLRAQVARS